MVWNWQHSDWPNFYWQQEQLISAEKVFIANSGIIEGSVKHLDNHDSQAITIEIIILESIGTSEIEGEILRRDSVRSSIMRALGLKSDVRANPLEEGVAQMMVDLYLTLNQPLTEQLLFNWHNKLMHHDKFIECIGAYRTFQENMQIVSGPDYARKIHFEAPPSSAVENEMQRFIDWFGYNQQGRLSAIVLAGVAHLWFESIHPFEDGNGRIGRAIAEKALQQRPEQAMPLLLSKTILKKRKQYYKELNKASISLDITDWLLWFSKVVLEAQQNTIAYIEFIIKKSKLFSRLKGELNSRQEKALLRIFREGPEGFTGGLSAANYMAITGATSATTTRDLKDLVHKQALQKKGLRKATRYYLLLDD